MSAELRAALELVMSSRHAPFIGNGEPCKCVVHEDAHAALASTSIDGVSGTGLEELRAEHAFLYERAMQAGAVRFTADRWTGTSSNALVRLAFGGNPPTDLEYPLDRSDLLACQITFEKLPAHLRPIVEPWLEKYRDAISSRA